ncbi:SET domain-containing protein-lysine N-methyltransferase [Chondromyces crocatus]|uniref:D-alanine--D-alanine ligase n=1 Tax=Chondromyces crocatus TaxID=52 RepID=A0A0K1EC03_CHOCO|nr:SET domain-containing protein-lysine N-methyltransferase [Chondromyces crocatus]AKT38088.1 uncharacterized protein CMC5_022300 [Chondromyces crocatus]
MRLCTLLASYERSESPFHGLDPYPDPSLWAPSHEWEVCLVDKATAVRTVRQLAKRGFDAFVNLCDGTWEEDCAGLEVVIELERQGQAYTGADPHFYPITRKAMKLMCHAVGIDTPRHVFAESRDEAELAAAHLRFPLFVKHPDGYGSLGLTAASRVTHADALFARVDQVVDAHGGALIEEFVEGREFTVLVAEPPAGERSPRCYPPLEVVFPPGESFKHFDLKWRGYDDLSSRPVEDADLAERLQGVAARIFEALKGVGYARCDIRMDRDGRLYLLDVNSNPGLFYPPEAPGAADLILSHDPGGHRGFIEHILTTALRRRDLRRPKWTLRHHPERGLGIVATVDIAAGERVFCNEERPMQLVTRAHVERTWPSWRKQVFARWAHPISDEVHAMWSDDPEAWFPTHHSCDPTVALDGLDFVARRPIRKGEAITLDHATLAGPSRSPSPCPCGSALCRGTIRSAALLAP